jgi:hypothetical protein
MYFLVIPNLIFFIIKEAFRTLKNTFSAYSAAKIPHIIVLHTKFRKYISVLGTMSVYAPGEAVLPAVYIIQISVCKLRLIHIGAHITQDSRGTVSLNRRGDTPLNILFAKVYMILFLC